MRMLDRFFNVILPERCVICSKIITDNIFHYPLCRPCERKLVLLKKNVCSVCGYPLVSEYNTCIRCRSIDFNFLTNRSLYMYNAAVKELIYQ